jgi:hypothetical protein
MYVEIKFKQPPKPTRRKKARADEVESLHLTPESADESVLLAQMPLSLAQN